MNGTKPQIVNRPRRIGGGVLDIKDGPAGKGRPGLPLTALVPSYDQPDRFSHEPSLGHVLARYGNLTCRTWDGWRVTRRIVGHINGLPGSQGVIIATNGILCLIEQSGGGLYEGHIEWFIPDLAWEAELRAVVAALRPKSIPMTAEEKAATKAGRLASMLSKYQ